MASVEIYTTPWCPYCVKAKGLLKKLGQSFVEYDIEGSSERAAEMDRRTEGAQTVPQIFIDGRHVGGCDDLHALHAAGELEPLLRGGTEAK